MRAAFGTIFGDEWTSNGAEATDPKNVQPDVRPLVKQAAEAMAAFVKKRGFEPYAAPDPLPPIEPGAVALVVWTAVEAEGTPEEIRT